MMYAGARLTEMAKHCPRVTSSPQSAHLLSSWNTHQGETGYMASFAYRHVEELRGRTYVPLLQDKENRNWDKPRNIDMVPRCTATQLEYYPLCYMPRLKLGSVAVCGSAHDRDMRCVSSSGS